MSYTYTRICTDLSPQVLHEVLQLAADNLTDLSLVPVPPSNHMYELYQYTIATEIALYIARITQPGDLRTELVLATTDGDEVVGFLQYLPVKDCTDACGITYMAVSARHRRKGVARGMVALMLETYPHAALSCVIEKVPLYEKLGFQVIGSRDGQVSMNTRDYVANGVIGTIAGGLFETEDALRIRAHLDMKYGRKAILDAQKRILRDHTRMVERTRKFVIEYMAKMGKVPVC